MIHKNGNIQDNNVHNLEWSTVYGDVPQKRTIWTFQLFLERAHEIHEDKYDYSNIKEEHVQNSHSMLTIVCRICFYRWDVELNDHISHKSGCKICNGRPKWTIETLLIRIKQVHADKYDFSLIEEEHLKGSKSRVPIICNTCKYKWFPRIDDLVQNKSHCRFCADKMPWTYEKLLSSVLDSGLDTEYDYSLIEPDDIHGCESQITIICLTCGNIWSSEIRNHIHSKAGCPKCKSSKGERECARVLKELNISFQTQFRIPSLINRKYDFYFVLENKRYILEYDGRIHFEYIPHIHKTYEYFMEKQEIDFIKSSTAVNNGFYLIRIDCTQIGNIRTHLVNAIKLLNDQQRVYLSNTEMYKYITDKISTA